MSEGEFHVRLVTALLGAMVRHYANDELTVCADIASTREYLPPTLIGNQRPDVWARTGHSRTTIVGEAKTPRDVDTLHTRAQLKAFLEFLACETKSVIWMSVPLAQAGEAMRLVRGLRQELKVPQVGIIVSGWLLGIQDFERRWHG